MGAQLTPSSLAFAGLPPGVASGLFVLIGIVAFVGLAKSLRVIRAPYEVLVIIGGAGGKNAAGIRRKYKIVTSGAVWKVPVLQQVQRMDLRLMEVPIAVRNAYSSGGIPMDVDAIANVKVSSDPDVVTNALERFMGRETSEIRRVAKETLEGHLRGVIATLTPEQVNEDRLRFAESLTKESEEDLKKLGLHLDTLKITHVKDEVGYLDATGRKAIALIVRQAEIAESDAKRAAEEAEAANAGRGNVTRANAETVIVKLRNEVRTIKADLEATINSEEERTAAAAREARAVAEQKLQEVRAELEAMRLEVDEVLPAEAQREADQYTARGDAALIRERGQAVSEALDLMHAAWNQAGPSATQIALIENIEKLLSAAAEGVQKVHIEGIRVVDSGDGKTLPNYLANYPAMLNSVFESVEKTVGIDVPGAISGRATKTAEEAKD